MLVLLMLVLLLTLSDLLNSIARKVLCAVVAYGLTSPPPFFRVSAIKGRGEGGGAALHPPDFFTASSARALSNPISRSFSKSEGAMLGGG